MSVPLRVFIVSVLLACLSGCTTSYVEFEGECLMQRWSVLGYTARLRQICDLPKPKTTGPDARVIRENEPMDTNAFPDLFGQENKADSVDPDLLEKRRLEIEAEGTER